MMQNVAARSAVPVLHCGSERVLPALHLPGLLGGQFHGPTIIAYSAMVNMSPYVPIFKVQLSNSPMGFNDAPIRPKVPSGKRLHGFPCLMGKLAILTGPCSIAMLHVAVVIFFHENY